MSPGRSRSAGAPEARQARLSPSCFTDLSGCVSPCHVESCAAGTLSPSLPRTGFAPKRWPWSASPPTTGRVRHPRRTRSLDTGRYLPVSYVPRAASPPHAKGKPRPAHDRSNPPLRPFGSKAPHTGATTSPGPPIQHRPDPSDTPCSPCPPWFVSAIACARTTTAGDSLPRDYRCRVRRVYSKAGSRATDGSIFLPGRSGPS
jgi:hypothetical protein